MKRRLTQLLACLLVCFGIPALRAQDASFATLRLTSEPVATFTLNNATLKTGLNVTQQVPSDTPLLLKVSAPGYQTQYKRLVLGAGERHHESFKLLREPIPVLFRSNTTATVLCNGAELGTTPFHTFFNEPKTYRIIIRAERTRSLGFALFRRGIAGIRERTARPRPPVLGATRLGRRKAFPGSDGLQKRALRA